MWNWMKSWFITSATTEFPKIILTIKPNPVAADELFAHFEFDWPNNTSDEVLSKYYGRVIAYLQAGALYHTILSGFESKYEKSVSKDAVKINKAKQLIHAEFQQILQKFNQSEQEEQHMEQHLRQPCMLPSDVFNFRNKGMKNGE